MNGECWWQVICYDCDTDRLLGRDDGEFEVNYCIDCGKQNIKARKLTDEGYKALTEPRK